MQEQAGEGMLPRAHVASSVTGLADPSLLFEMQGRKLRCFFPGC